MADNSILAFIIFYNRITLFNLNASNVISFNKYLLRIYNISGRQQLSQVQGIQQLVGEKRYLSLWQFESMTGKF